MEIVSNNEAYIMASILHSSRYHDEIYDALYHYMQAIENDWKFDVALYTDEIENLMGIRDHASIIEYIVDSYRKFIAVLKGGD